MKPSAVASHALRSLVAGGQRTFLAILCVATGVTAVVALQLVGTGASDGLTQNIRAINGGDLQVTTNGRGLTAAELGALDDLRSRGVLTRQVTAYSVPGHVVGLRSDALAEVRAVPAPDYPLAGPRELAAPAGGRIATVLHGDRVVVNDALARSLSVRVGDRVSLATADGRAAPATVAGVLPRGSQVFPAPLVLVETEWFQALPSALGQRTGPNLVFADVPGHTDAAAEVARRQVARVVSAAFLTTAAGSLRSNSVALVNLRAYLHVAGLLALLIGGVAVVNTMQILLRRRGLEIAVLKTAGCRRRDLYVLFGAEALAIGIFGGVLGTLAGAAASYGVADLLGRGLGVAVPITLRATVIAEGLATGALTACIFGIIPIAQAGDVRPIAVLWDDGPETVNRPAVLLLGLVGALFVAMAIGITGDPLATAVIAVAAIVGLGALGSVLRVLVDLVAGLPVAPERRRVLAIGAGAWLVLGAVLALASPALAAIPLAVGVLLLGLVLLRARSRAVALMALRNLGRQRARTVTSAVALFVGVLALGLLVLLGQTATAAIHALVQHGPANAAVISTDADHRHVDAALASTPGVDSHAHNLLARVTPVAVNGEPIDAFMQRVDPQHLNQPDRMLLRLGQFASLQGYDLARGQVPNPTSIAFYPDNGAGSEDSAGRDPKVTAPRGRNLRAGDAGTTNVLIASEASWSSFDGPVQAAFYVGDTITVRSLVDGAELDLHVVGEYTQDDATEQFFGKVLADDGTVAALTGGRPGHLDSLRLDSRTEDAALRHLRTAVPGAQVYSFTDLFASINEVLDALLIALEAVAGLSMLAAVVMVANSVALAMLERRRDLGILKAVGYTNGAVLASILIEQAALALITALPALGFAAALLTLFSFGLTRQTNVVPAPVVLGIVAGVAVVTGAVGLAVAWQPVHRRPLDVLRYE